MSSDKPKTKVVRATEMDWECFKDPSHYFILDAMGDRVYFLTRDRPKAIAWCDSLYGKGKYNVRSI